MIIKNMNLNITLKSVLLYIRGDNLESVPARPAAVLGGVPHTWQHRRALC